MTTRTTSAASTAVPFLHPGMKVPFIMVVTCFAAWGIAANMTDPMVGAFKSVFDMSLLQSALVQSAYYGAYFLLAIPAAFLNSRFSYKVGVLVGLALATAGGALFVPAASAMTFNFFLLALFTLAAGLSVLETSANPFVLSMGPRSNATRRLNFAQSFNPIGTLSGSAIAAIFILPAISSPEDREGLSAEAAQSQMQDELLAISTPYVVLAVVLAIILVGIFLTRIPGQKASTSFEVDPRGSGSRISRLWANKPYVFGVAAQYFNVAGQTCIWTYTTVYVVDTLDKSQGEAGRWLIASLIIFGISRFLMVFLMGFIDSRKLMITMCLIGIVLTMTAVLFPSVLGAVAVVASSASLSLLFPTIYGLALQDLSAEDQKFGAAGLVMAIVGGATLPLVAAAIGDASAVNYSYIIPAVCFALIAAYGVYTLKAIDINVKDDVDPAAGPAPRVL